MSYSEPLRQLIRSAQASEKPEDILEVARALELAGFEEDALEWRRWYVHLRPGDAAELEQPRRNLELANVCQNLSRSIASLRPKAPVRLLGWLDEAQRAVELQDVPAAERALLRFLQARADLDDEDGGGGVPRTPPGPVLGARAREPLP